MLEINRKDSSDTVILTPSGSLCADHIEIFRNALDELRKGGPEQRNIILDMGSVGFIDSAAIASLVSRYQGLEKLGKRLFIIRMNKNVRKLFDDVFLTQYFRIFPSLEDVFRRLEKERS